MESRFMSFKDENYEENYKFVFQVAVKIYIFI